MTLRALVVCPESYRDTAFRDLPGSVDAAAAFVRRLLAFSQETCRVTVFADPQGGTGALDVLLRDTGPHVVDLAPPRLDTLVHRLTEHEDGVPFLAPADGFVLYWLGHGGLDRDGKQWLYLSQGKAVELTDVLTYMCRRGRPKRQLYVIDACRSADERAGSSLGSGAHMFARGAGRPHPDHTDQLVLYASRPGEQAVAVDNPAAGGGVFTTRLVAALESGPPPGLDLDWVERRATELEAVFRREFQLYEVEQIPTHFAMRRQGGDRFRSDYRLWTTVTDAQADELAAIIDATDIGPREKGDVLAALAAAGLQLPYPIEPLSALAGHVAKLPHPLKGDPYIVTLCLALSEHTAAAAEVRSWYDRLLERVNLPPLRTPAPAATVGKCHLVVALSEVPGPAGASGAALDPQAGPYYAVQSWFYTGPELTRIEPEDGGAWPVWPKSRLTEAFWAVRERAYGMVGTALDTARVEFIVQRDLFDYPFDALSKYAVPSGTPPPAGDSTPVVLRDRWRHRRGSHLIDWARRGPLLETVPAAALHWRQCATAEDDSVAIAFGGPATCAGIVLDRPRAADAAADDVADALNAGAALAIWPRSGCHDGCPLRPPSGGDCRGPAVRDALRTALGTRPLQEIPEIMFELRRRETAVNGTFRNIAVLFDDPRRSPLVWTPVSTPVKERDEE